MNQLFLSLAYIPYQNDLVSIIIGYFMSELPNIHFSARSALTCLTRYQIGSVVRTVDRVKAEK